MNVTEAYIKFRTPLLAGAVVENGAVYRCCSLPEICPRRYAAILIEAISFYRQRWGIETLFGHLKTREFNLESTQLRDPDRVVKLVGLLTLAFSWAHKAGQWIAEVESIIIKKSRASGKESVPYGTRSYAKVNSTLRQQNVQKSIQRMCQALKTA